MHDLRVRKKLSPNGLADVSWLGLILHDNEMLGFHCSILKNETFLGDFIVKKNTLLQHNRDNVQELGREIPRAHL